MGRKSRVKTRGELAREERGTQESHLRELAQRKLKQQIRQRKQTEKWKQKKALREGQPAEKLPKDHLAALLIRESLKLPVAFSAPRQEEMAAVYHKANSQRLPPESYTPWLAGAAVGPGVPFSRVSLHDEILAFQRYVSLRPEEVGARDAINALIRDVVQLANDAHPFCVNLGINLTWQSRWPGAVVATFGSLAASLSTFLSDIDVTVCDAQQARQHQEDKSGVPHMFEAKDDEDETDSDDEAEATGKGRMGGKGKTLGKRTRDEETESEGDEEETEDDDDDEEEEEEEEGQGRREQGSEKGEGEEQGEEREVIEILDSESEDDVVLVEREGQGNYTFNVMFHENPKPRGQVPKGAASAPQARQDRDAKLPFKPRHTQSEIQSRYQAKGHLMRLYPGFTRLPVLLHSEMRLHARVPIINLRFLNNVEADIRIHPPDTNAVRFLQRLAERHAPAFTALAVLLKVVCFMHDIDKPFNGGLGSFKLYVLLAHFLANHPGQNIGNLLKKFLQIYSRAGALNHTMILRVEGQDITLQGQLELEKIRACFEMCHKILTTDDVKQVRRATGEGTGPSTQTRLARMLWGLALGRLREEAHRQARSAIEPLSQVELTQAGRRLLDKLRRETSSEYPSLEELRHRFPKAASHMEVYCTLFRQDQEWRVDSEAAQRARQSAQARSKPSNGNGKAHKRTDKQHKKRAFKKARMGNYSHTYM